MPLGLRRIFKESFEQWGKINDQRRISLIADRSAKNEQRLPRILNICYIIVEMIGLPPILSST